jgi:predicted small metal-binding protein
VTRSEDENELFEEIKSHARDAHGMDEVPPEVVDQINDVITEV